MFQPNIAPITIDRAAPRNLNASFVGPHSWAAPTARFGVPAAKLGLMVDTGMVRRLARLAGRGAAGIASGEHRRPRFEGT